MFRQDIRCAAWLVLSLFLTGEAAPISKVHWQEDLRYFARELPKRHKNLYHATPRERFERAVAELDAAIPSLQDHQIIVRLHQIGASVGDGHTGVHISPSFGIYPISVYRFGDGLRVIAARKEYESALGTRVVKIGGLGIDDVEARVRTCFPSAENENEWYVMSTSPAFIVRPEFLQALGIVPDVAAAPFTFEDDQGRQSTLEIKAVPVPPATGGVVSLGLLPAAKAQPLYRQKQGEPFWFTYLPENDEMTLPHSRLVVSYSTKYYKFLDEDVPAVMPDKRIDPDWTEWQAGRDPVMDWILSR